jgi:hypothetical protein
MANCRGICGALLPKINFLSKEQNQTGMGCEKQKENTKQDMRENLEGEISGLL